MILSVAAYVHVVSVTIYSPGWYIKELVSRLTAKPCSDVEKVAILPCFIQK